eukprot:g5665.t1
MVEWCTVQPDACCVNVSCPHVSAWSFGIMWIMCLIWIIFSVFAFFLLRRYDFQPRMLLWVPATWECSPRCIRCYSCWRPLAVLGLGFLMFLPILFLFAWGFLTRVEKFLVLNHNEQ